MQDLKKKKKRKNDNMIHWCKKNMHEKCKYLTNKGFVERTFVWYMNDSSTYFNRTILSVE